MISVLETRGAGYGLTAHQIGTYPTSFEAVVALLHNPLWRMTDAQLAAVANECEAVAARRANERRATVEAACEAFTLTTGAATDPDDDDSDADDDGDGTAIVVPGDGADVVRVVESSP